MIAIISIVVLILCLVIGGPLLYFFVIKEDTTPVAPPGMDPNYGSGEAVPGAATETGSKEGDSSLTVNVPGSESNTVSSSSGGLDSAPPPPGEYTPLASYNERNPICEASICTGEKVLKSSSTRGTTIDQCCRDKACEIDWNPDLSGVDIDPCLEDGMVRDDEYTNGRDGKTNAECCKFDTTSYSKWCVQEVAYKADGTTEKTSSPSPWRGGYGDLHWKNRVAGSPDQHHLGDNKEIAFGQCKNKCDQEPDCHAIYLNANGTCRLQKKVDSKEDLHSGYEKFNKDDEGDGAGEDGLLVRQENAKSPTGEPIRGRHEGGEFYIKSTFVPEDIRKQTINGELKVAGRDEEYCPLKYTSIYGNARWDTTWTFRDHAVGGHHGVHIQPNLVHTTANSSGCFNAGTTHHGVTLGTSNNSTEPVVRWCSQLCDKFDDCGGFFVYTDGPRKGRCCLKSELSSSAAPTSYLTKHIEGAYFVRNKDGVMGNRPWRKSVDSAK